MSKLLQVVGGLVEFVGLAVVAAGIVATRTTYEPDRLGILDKVGLAVSRFVARLTRRGRSIDLQVDDALHVHSAASARLRVQLGFPGSLEERVQRLQEIAQRHEDSLDNLADRIGSEAEKLRAEVKSVRDELQASEQELVTRINETATNGLTTETVGVALFMIGVVLTTSGALIA